MARIYAKVSDLIGGTPLVAFDALAQAHGLQARILGKLECMNPAGSAKDRAARSMIEHAERTGKLKPGAIKLYVFQLFLFIILLSLLSVNH